MEAKWAMFSAFSIFGALMCIFALDALLFAGTEHSYANAIRKMSIPQVRMSLTNSTLCSCASNETIKEVPKECPKASHIPWYQQGKAWHYPMKFPRCTMDVCFNYSRCDNMEELLIYTYPSPPPLKFFINFNKTKWHTSDPDKACLFFVFTENRDPYHGPYPEHPSKKLYWNGGLNHVLVSFSDMWELSHIDQESIGKASLLRTDTHESIYRPGFDISMSLPPHHRFEDLQSFKPWNRKYFLSFRGLRYLGPLNDYGIVRSYNSFREIHNGKDIVVAVSCNHPVNNEKRKANATLGVHCDEDEVVYRQYGDYKELMNSTFGLAPAGIQPSSYRFTEILSGGGIPVVVADNYVKPYDTLVQWYKCILQFPTSEMRRIVPTLRMMSRYEMEKRQEYCLKVYRTYLASDERIMEAVVDSLKARFMGALPGLMPNTSLSYM